MQIKDLISEQLVALELKGATKEEVMQELIGRMAKSGAVADAAGLKQALRERENSGSTGIGFGIAIPHAKTDAVASPRLAFGISPQGVDWESLDGSPARLIFMIAVPQNGAGQEHLVILQKLSRKLIDSQFRESLSQAASEREVISLLEQIA